MAKRPVQQPSLDDERQLLGIIDNEATEIPLGKRVIRMRMLTGHAQHRITQVLLGKGREDMVSCKCVAAARLNGYFKIKFLWWLVWRWYFYIRQYSEADLAPAVAEIKKKVPLTDYLANTTYLIAIRETMMQMNREEVSRSLQELSGGNAGKSARNASGSPSPSK
ncbi:MAG: hypothetical protein NC311_07605 [Muribaculaceae bacterium]|nr:hypothetical protein [Muribaculaceae bacterium]